MSYKLSTPLAGQIVHLRRQSLLHPGEYRELLCPFKSPESCGEWCPHFEVEEFLGKLRVSITCTPCQKRIAIDSEDSPCDS